MVMGVIPRRPLIVVALGAVAVLAGSAESRASRRAAAALRDGSGLDWQRLDADAKRSLGRRYLRTVGRRDIVALDVVEATDDFVVELGADVTARSPMRALIDAAVRAADEREWAAVVGDQPGPVPALQVEGAPRR
jgi:hypothetical protein